MNPGEDLERGGLRLLPKGVDPGEDNLSGKKAETRCQVPAKRDLAAITPKPSSRSKKHN